MKKSILPFLITLLLLPISINSQELRGGNFIVKANGDTLFCNNIEYSTNFQGYIVDLSYTTMDGKEVKLHKKKNIPVISCIHRGSSIRDIMPLKTKKPYGYYRVGNRMVNGKLKVSLYNDKHQSTYFDPYDKNHQRIHGTSYKTGTSGTYLFYIKMTDGKFYKINKSNLKKVIKPYLLQCEKFKNEYKGQFSLQEEAFIQMIILYNKLCS